MSERKHVSAFVLCLVALTACGCNDSQSEANRRICALLEANDFTMFTPFRTDDYPGTVFVQAKNHRGRSTEMTLSSFTETFSVPPGRLFDPNGQEVSFVDELNEQFSGSAELDLDIVSVLLKPGMAGKYFSKFSVRFGDPKLVHRMTLARLADVRFDLSDEARQVLSDYKEMDQLKNVYIVVETVTVGSVEIELELKNELRGKTGLEEIKHLAKADVSAETISAGRFKLKIPRRVMIGYKAAAFPDTILRREVSELEPVELEMIRARDFNRMKAK